MAGVQGMSGRGATKPGGAENTTPGGTPPFGGSPETVT